MIILNTRLMIDFKCLFTFIFTELSGTSEQILTKPALQKNGTIKSGHIQQKIIIYDFFLSLLNSMSIEVLERLKMRFIFKSFKSEFDIRKSKPDGLVPAPLEPHWVVQSSHSQLVKADAKQCCIDGTFWTNQLVWSAKLDANLEGVKMRLIK